MTNHPRQKRPQLEEDMYESTFIDNDFDDLEGTEFIGRTYIKEYLDDEREMESAKFGNVSDYF